VNYLVLSSITYWNQIILKLFDNFDPKKDLYDRIFICLLALGFLLRIIWLDKPEGSLIFDEKYYVNIARIILKLPHDPDVYEGATLGLDPNQEHPFLAKGIIALSISLLGDNAWGWRIPSVILGTLSIFLFYLLIKKLSNKNELALLSAFLMTFSNLIFVHSRIATLDIFMLFFMLLGFYWYFTNKIFLSSFALALSTMSKLNGMFGFFTIIIFHFVFSFFESRKYGKKFNWTKTLNWVGRYSIIYFVSVFLLFLLLDWFWVGYKNPFDHLAYIYNYNMALTREVLEDIESYPWQWLLNEVRIPYLIVNVDVSSDSQVIETYTSVAFQGVMNPFIIFLAIPSIIYSAYTAIKIYDKTALFAVILFSTIYLPYYPASLISHRIMYLFYFLPTIPSICIAISNIFAYQRSLRIIFLIYAIAVIIGFAFLFPFKTFP